MLYAPMQYPPPMDLDYPYDYGDDYNRDHDPYYEMQTDTDS